MFVNPKTKQKYQVDKDEKLEYVFFNVQKYFNE